MNIVLERAIIRLENMKNDIIEEKKGNEFEQERWVEISKEEKRNYYFLRDLMNNVEETEKELETLSKSFTSFQQKCYCV